MRWIDARQLSTWASERIDARSALPRLVGQLIRASVTDVTAFRFPAGDSAQIQGWDGQLVARPEGAFKTYIPEGSSVWEWGVAKSPETKAQSDWNKRKKNPGDGIIRGSHVCIRYASDLAKVLDMDCNERKERDRHGRTFGSLMESPWKNGANFVQPPPLPLPARTASPRRKMCRTLTSFGKAMLRASIHN